MNSGYSLHGNSIPINQLKDFLNHMSSGILDAKTINIELNGSDCLTLTAEYRLEWCEFKFNKIKKEKEFAASLTTCKNSKTAAELTLKKDTSYNNEYEEEMYNTLISIFNTISRISDNRTCIEETDNLMTSFKKLETELILKHGNK